MKICEPEVQSHSFHCMLSTSAFEYPSRIMGVNLPKKGL